MVTVIFWLVVIGLVVFVGFPTIFAVLAVFGTLIIGLLAYAIYLVPFIGFFILWRIVVEIIRRRIS